MNAAPIGFVTGVMTFISSLRFNSLSISRNAA